MRCFLLIIAGLLFAAGCGENAPETADNETDTGQTEVRTLVKIDSIGVELGDSTLVFGAIEGMVTGPDGNIAVLDRAACCIKIFTTEGDFVRQISRRGNGPGELISTGFLAITGNGTLILAGDGSETVGVHSFDYFTGSWTGSETSYGAPPTCLEGASGATYMRKSLEMDPTSDEPVAIARITLNEIGREEPLVLFQETRIPLNLENMGEVVSLVWFGYDLACDFSGRFYVAPRSTQEAVVYAYDAAGEELFTIVPDGEPTLRSLEELETERLVLAAKATAMDSAEIIPSLQPDPYKPMIRGLEVDAEGNLWVLAGGPAQPTFQVFDRTGCYLYTAVLQGEVPDGHSWNFNFSGGNILAYAEDPALGFQKLYVLALE